MEKFGKSKNNKSGKGKMRKKIKKGAGMALRGLLVTSILAATPTESIAPKGKEEPKVDKKQIEVSAEAMIQAKEKEVVEAVSFVEEQKKIEDKKEEIQEKISKGIESEIEKPKETFIEKKFEYVKLNIANFTEKMKDIFRPIVEEEATFKDLKIVSQGNTLNFSMELKANGIPITVTGDVVNKGKGLSLENTDIQASFFKKKITKRIKPLLEIVIPEILDSLRGEYGGVIEQINIDESGNINITFKKGNT